MRRVCCFFWTAQCKVTKNYRRNDEINDDDRDGSDLDVLSEGGCSRISCRRPICRVSYTRVNTATISGLGSFPLNGGEFALSYAVKPWVTAVADFGVTAVPHHPSNIIVIEIHGQQTSYLFGPRLAPFHWRRTTPFVQGLFGIAHASHGLYDTTGSQLSFAWAADGGDIRLNGSFSLRLLQVDFFQSKFTEGGNGRQYQNDLRACTGIVFHFQLAFHNLTRPKHSCLRFHETLLVFSQALKAMWVMRTESRMGKRQKLRFH
jgi:hypothetical protein